MSDAGPERERLDTPDLDSETLTFVLERLGQMAMDFGLEAMIDPQSPESVSGFVEKLEGRISTSELPNIEKGAALNMLEQIVDMVRELQKKTRGT